MTNWLASPDQSEAAEGVDKSLGGTPAFDVLAAMQHDDLGRNRAPPEVLLQASQLRGSDAVVRHDQLALGEPARLVERRILQIQNVAGASDRERTRPS